MGFLLIVISDRATAECHSSLSHNALKIRIIIITILKPGLSSPFRLLHAPFNKMHFINRPATINSVDTIKCLLWNTEERQAKGFNNAPVS